VVPFLFKFTFAFFKELLDCMGEEGVRMDIVIAMRGVVHYSVDWQAVRTRGRHLRGPGRPVSGGEGSSPHLLHPLHLVHLLHLLHPSTSCTSCNSLATSSTFYTSLASLTTSSTSSTSLTTSTHG